MVNWRKSLFLYKSIFLSVALSGALRRYKTCYGDKIPNKELLKDVSTIIIGHEHPAVSIKEGPRVELFKCFLIGKWKDKRIIVLPSFNLVVEGTDILKERSLSPFLKGSLRNFNVVVVADKLYEFGKVWKF